MAQDLRKLKRVVWGSGLQTQRQLFWLHVMTYQSRRLHFTCLLIAAQELKPHVFIWVQQQL